MQYLSTKLTEYMLYKKVIQEDDFEVYQYGIQNFLEISVSIICSVIIAFLLNMKLECIIFFLFFIPLRSYGGGLHMKTYCACLFFSCITLFLILLIVKYITLPCSISFMAYLFSYLSLKLIGPVDHPNREVDNEENQLFKKKTNLFLLISLFIAVLLWYIEFEKYLLLEALIFLLISFTSFIGKIKYSL